MEARHLIATAEVIKTTLASRLRAGMRGERDAVCH